MAEVSRVPKNGTNKAQNYNYATESDVADMVRGEMAKRQLLLVPTVVGEKWESRQTNSGATMKICTLRIRFTVFDGESGDMISFELRGQGEDTGDKATYKAMTGANKYALLKLFQVSTGDDPEKDDGKAEPPAPAGLAGVKAKLPQPSPPKVEKKDGRTHHDIVMGNFGKQAGKHLSEMSDNDVSWYREACKRTIGDPSKSKFHANETQRLACFDAELRFRGLPL